MSAGSRRVWRRRISAQETYSAELTSPLVDCTPMFGLLLSETR